MGEPQAGGAHSGRQRGSPVDPRAGDAVIHGACDRPARPPSAPRARRPPPTRRRGAGAGPALELDSDRALHALGRERRPEQEGDKGEDDRSVMLRARLLMRGGTSGRWCGVHQGVRMARLATAPTEG